MPQRVVQYPSRIEPPPLPPPAAPAQPVGGWQPNYPDRPTRRQRLPLPAPVPELLAPVPPPPIPPGGWDPNYPSRLLCRESVTPTPVEIHLPPPPPPVSRLGWEPGFPVQLRGRRVTQPPGLTRPDYPYTTTNTEFVVPLTHGPTSFPPRRRGGNPPTVMPQGEPPTTRAGMWGWEPNFPARLRGRVVKQPPGHVLPAYPYVGVSPPPPPGTSFTGQIGIVLSRGANVVPGYYSVQSPPPPPVVVNTDGPAFVPAAPMRTLFAFSFAPSLSRRPFVATLPNDAPPNQAVAAAANREAYPIPFPAGPLRSGPFSRLPKIVGVTDHTDFPASPPPPPPIGAQVYPPFYGQFDLAAKNDLFRFAPVPALPVSPDAGGFDNPTVPPPPPPFPSGPLIGPQRTDVPSIPRAPLANDDRARPHMDKVATLLNDLLRKGYIRQIGRDEYAISGGAFSFPRAPTVYDDNTVGAFVGATYVDTTTYDIYMCVNSSTGSAVWKLIG